MASLQVVEDGDDIEGEQLRNLIERIERLEEEKAVLADHVRSVYAEAKSSGFDPKIIRKVVRLRKMDPRDVDEEETLIHMYMRALGME
ncbi:DUF2312 domain-containing protein [Candidatus Magnetaquicoccus inordinatus]|uniref:DUF2312 domain-containing protein n=1 Tax=Candidatus Magnetaquicoccus inordinatus TaxID=2496818 RepID=UPI00102B09D7|nr:DUF2312 domain-containing protein [Candidatus Magnetaquicoccus inordinatus]